MPIHYPMAKCSGSLGLSESISFIEPGLDTVSWTKTDKLSITSNGTSMINLVHSLVNLSYPFKVPYKMYGVDS